MLLYLGLRTLWLSAQEQQWKKMKQEKSDKATRCAMIQMPFLFCTQGLLAYIAGHVLPFQSSEPEVVEVVEARARGGEGYTIQPR